MLRAFCCVICLLLVGCNGDIASPDAEQGDGGTLEDGQTNGTPPDAGEATPPPIDVDTFAVFLPFDTLAIREGVSTEVAVQVLRNETHERAIDLELVVESGTGLRAALSTTRLEASASLDTTVTAAVQFPVGRLPTLARDERIVVVARDGREEFQATLAVAMTPINAPDVYLLIGQSNMVGASQLDARNSGPGGVDEPSPRIRQLNVRPNNSDLWAESDFANEDRNVVEPRFITAEDPLHEPSVGEDGSKGGTQVGMGLSFAKAALANTSRDIVLVPAAWEATSFCAQEGHGNRSWNASNTGNPALGGTLLADRALTRLNMTLRDTGGVWRGMLWHQGESDSFNFECAGLYEQNLRALITRLRSDAIPDARGAAARGPDADVPFILGTMSRGTDDRGDFSFLSGPKEIVDTVHRTLPEGVTWSASVNADDLVPSAWPCGQGSCIHFGAASYRELGVRFYDALRNVTP